MRTVQTSTTRPVTRTAAGARRRAGRRPLGLAVAGVLAVVVGVPALPAAAAPPTTTASVEHGQAPAPAAGEVEDAPAAGVPVPASPSGEPAQAAAQDPAALAARVELDRAVAAAQVELDARSSAAAAALEARQGAVRARDAADLVHQQEVDRLAEAHDQEQRSGDEVARWTSQAYRHGVAGGDVAELMAVVDAGGPEDLQLRLAGLRQVGRAESRDLLDARDARSEAQGAVRRSADTADAARQAADEAERAGREADEQVAALGEKVAALAVLREQAGGPPADPSGLGPAAPGATLAGCSGDDVGAWANGQIPVSALCALPGHPGKVLRFDAASAFAAMSAAYAAGHGGQGLCVTDAYRDLPSQVAVRAARPGLAAVPGTSEHGWGVALDLCGGVQDASSTASGWMRANAGLYGWFHPSWAQVGGALPEAWHWEFAG